MGSGVKAPPGSSSGDCLHPHPAKVLRLRRVGEPGLKGEEGLPSQGWGTFLTLGSSSRGWSWGRGS